MCKPLRVLFVQDSENDVLLVLHMLKESGYDPTYERVDKLETMQNNLQNNEWDVVLADHLMPGFSGIDALKLLKETGLDIPFIIVSGKIGEETAVEIMKAGAHGYIVKGDLKRLIPSINRELKEASVRKENRQAEEALKKSEESYRTLVENLNVGIYRNTGDPQGRFIQANPAIVRMFGYGSVDEFMKIKVSDLYQEPEDRKYFVDAINQTGAVINKELHLRRKDNKSIWASVSARAHYDNNGGIDWIDGVIEDITERKQAERLLKESEARYRAIVEAYDGYIYICSQDYHVEFMNKRLIERAGYDGTGEKCYKVIHDRDSVCPWCINNRVFKGETVHWEVRSPKDNRWLYVVNVPLYHVDGSISKQSLFLDITDRKRVEEELRQAHDNLEILVEERTAELSEKNRQLLKEIEERRLAEEKLCSSEEKYRHIYENIQDVYYEVSIDGIILELSPSVENLTKYKRVELIGRSVYEIYAYHEERKEFLKSIMETGRVTDYEVTMKDEDGRLITVSLCSMLVFGEKGIPHKIVGTMRNVTERKKAEDALRASEEKYRSVVDNVGIGIALVSPNMEILTLNNQMKKWFPNIDISQKNVCYNVFNNPPGEKVCSYCPTYKTLQDGQVHESVTETPAGPNTKNYRIISSPVRDKEGKIIAAIEMVDDITEKNKMQERLKESEIYYRTIFETTAAATMIVEEDTTISLVNTEFEKLTGYTKNEIEGQKSWTEFVVEADLERMKKYHYLRRIDPEAAPRNYEYRFIDRGGNIRNIFMTVAMIPGTKKSVVSNLDITELKCAEESLRESEKRLSDIIDFLPDATFAVDQDKKVIAWNRAIEEMTRTKAEEILGKGDYEYALPFYGIRKPLLIDLIFKADEEVEKKYVFLQKEEDVILGEADVSLKGGNRTLWGKARPLYDSKGCIVGAIQSIRDITERRRAEKALKKREKELEIKSRNLEELNTALKVLLKQREEDKDELEERTLTNVKHLLLPYIEKLKKSHLETKDAAYITIIESNLKDIISPFSHRLSSKYMTFTPKELQVANLIKEGKTTKDIAELLNASPGTIDFHRNNIRRKLNLKNRRANLRSYLMTLS